MRVYNKNDADQKCVTLLLWYFRTEVLLAMGQ